MVLSDELVDGRARAAHRRRTLPRLRRYLDAGGDVNDTNDDEDTMLATERAVWGRWQRR